ncbi:carboxypeptidase family protein [Paenibacillus cellulosilyticus]|uniref:Carboxypeptidase family protein n=1 Tax=Paenibacillus cellulosilyticus TaxID=375489 RepID=A0A2V2Z1D1_9BACL|nr:carboxypeptidase regulatory-like domain-containing protein [Paenibacillus cellulosilyticus]PWW08622.1 carboxypeptidase family protein [Paenibacillus cellulosilyticus]QKS48190.1 carboxypeptidase regulatory-like domain-containing protein [Paenibacillus cellulosilyticus]
MTFPSNIQFVPIRVNGMIPSDPAGDVTPVYLDIVGDAQFPPAYYAYDGQNAYFRFRLQGDPRVNTTFQSNVWGVLFDINGDSSNYEWMLALTGANSHINLFRNSAQSGSPLDDPPDEYANFSRPINNFDLGRARLTEDGSTFGGASNYFLDFILDTGTLFSQLVINANTPIRMLFFTSQTTRSFDKDSLPFSDIVTFNQANVRASLTAQQQLVNPPAVLNAGQLVTLQFQLLVSNTGSSGASTILASLPFNEGDIQNVTPLSTTVGSANYNATTRTLSWNIGSLDSSASALLVASIDIILTNAGTQTLNTFLITGIDQFTGNILPSVTGELQVQVQASGSVSGIIQNKNTAQPLQNVLVQLLPAGTPQTLSFAEGGYGLTGIAPGSYTVQFSLAQFQTLQFPVTIEAGQSVTLNVMLVPEPATVSGTVTSAQNGAIVPGATLRVLDSVGVMISETMTDTNGRYTFPSIPAEQVRLVAGADGFQQQSRVLNITPAAALQIDLALEPSPGGVTGIVTTSAGQPVADALVSLTNDQTVSLIEVTTAANGEYTVNQLVPNLVYLIRATAPAFTAASTAVRVGAGAIVTVDLVLSPAPGSLSGEVREEGGSGAALPGVSLILQDVDGITLTTTSTDEAGQFGIASLAPGSYTLIVNESGFANRSMGVQIVSNQDTFVSIALIRQSGSISGSVITTSGQPVENAVLTVLLNSTVIVKSATDVDGQFNIVGLFPDVYIIRAEAAGFSTQSLGVLVQPLQDTVVQFKLESLTGEVSGFVTDETGTALAGVSVRVFFNRLSSMSLLTQTLTDEQGQYIVNDLQAGLFLLNVSLQGFQSTVGVIEIEPPGQETLSFQLLRNPGRIEGVVLNDLREPITDVTVAVAIINSIGLQISLIFADLTGRYVSGDLAPGFYAIAVSAVGFRTDQVTREVLSDTVTEANIILLPQPGSIQGTVTDQITSEPIAGISIAAYTQNGIALAITLSDSSGFYRLDGLRPGGYTILASAPLYENNLTGAVVVPDTVTVANIAITQVTGVLVGTINPVVDIAQIKLYTVHNTLLQSVYTIADGGFRFPFLQSGSYTLTAEASGFSADAVGATIRAGETTETIIQLRANPGSIAGTVTGEQGDPITNATIIVVDRNEVVRGDGQTGQFGHYVVGNLPQGTLSLIVSAIGFTNVIGAVQITPGASLQDIDFVLIANAGGISGNIIDAVTKLPITGAEIQVRQSDASGLTVAAAVSGELGDFLITSLAPAAYAILVFAAGYATGVIGATVVSDQTTSASLSLVQLTGTISGSIMVAGGLPLDSNGTSIRLFTVSGTLYTTQFADGSGRFNIPDLPPNTYELSVTAPGFVTDSQTIFLEANQVVSVSFTLVPEVIRITGTVFDDSNSKPIEGALVGQNGRTGFPIDTTFTDNNGTFMLSSSPLTRLTLFVSAVGFGSRSAALNTLPGQNITIDFRLQPNPGTVFGFVTNLVDGTALAGVEVKLFTRSQVQLATVLTDNSGSYSYPQLTPDDYLCIAIAQNFAASQGGFTITPGAEVKYSFALQPLPASIIGRVTDAATGLPIVNGVVVLRPFNNFAAPLSLTSTDHNGSYVLEELLEGNYTLNLSVSGYNTIQSSFFAGRGQQIRQDFAVRRTTALVDGTITDQSTGKPVPDALVTVVDRNGIIVGQGVTDSTGLYLVGTGSQSETAIIAVVPGFQFGQTTANLSPGQRATLNVSLAPGPLSISGVTRSAATGAPVSGVVLSVLTESKIVIESIASDAEGRYAFRSMAPGSYIVTATAPTYASSAQIAQIASGGSAIVNFDLPSEFGNLTGTIRDTDGRPLDMSLAEVFLIVRQPASQQQVQIHAATRRRRRVNRPQLPALPISVSVNVFMRSTIGNASGRYTLTNLPPGTIAAVFSFPEKQTVVREALIIAGQTTVLDIVLEDEGEE